MFRDIRFVCTSCTYFFDMFSSIWIKCIAFFQLNSRLGCFQIRLFIKRCKMVILVEFQVFPIILVLSHLNHFILKFFISKSNYFLRITLKLIILQWGYIFLESLDLSIQNVFLFLNFLPIWIQLLSSPIIYTNFVPDNFDKIFNILILSTINLNRPFWVLDKLFCCNFTEYIWQVYSIIQNRLIDSSP